MQNRVHLVASFTLALAASVASGQPQLDKLSREQAYLKSGNSEPGDEFGAAVAMSGDTLVVGAWSEDSSATGIDGDGGNNGAASSGAVYVFVRKGEDWTQQAYLKASNTGADDQFGRAVAISGDTIVVGATGEDSSATGVNGDGGNNDREWSGAAYVFVRDAGVWSQQAYLKASTNEVFDYFGGSVAISGDTVLVGASGEDSGATGVNGDEGDNSADTSGAAYVFVRNGTTWSQEAYLKASNTGASDEFGRFLALDGDTAVIAGWREDSNATGVDGNQNNDDEASSGAVYVFTRSGTTWSQQAYLKSSNAGSGDEFGSHVAVSGDTILVGAYGEASSATGVDGNGADNSAAGAGAAYVFTRTGTAWSEQAYLKASNTGAGDFFGGSVALSGDRALIGAYGEASQATGVNGNGGDDSAATAGAAYAFTREGTTWTQEGYLKASNTGAGDRFGWRVGVSGDSWVVGAPKEDSNATGIDGDGLNDLAAEAGAAHAFGLCTGLAAEVVRVGTPPNPAAFLPGVTSGPVIGSVWDPIVDHTTFVPTALGDFMIFSPTTLEVDLGFSGTLLCGVPFLDFLPLNLTPALPFEIPIPPDCGLVGIGLCAQIGSSPDGSTFFLANALDITIGAM